MNLKKYIHEIPDFPEEGISFKDITPLLKSPEALSYCIEAFAKFVKKQGVSKIAGIDSRGFIFGSALAYKTQLPFVLIRKKGKLPKETFSESYGLEYGKDHIELHKEDIEKGEKVLLVDDVLATGGTMEAAIKLIQKAGGEVTGISFLIELEFLKGKNKLKDIEIQSLVSY